MASDLERRYRRCLRCLPAWYRQQWADEMVSTLLDSEPDARWPRPGEVLSVLSLSLRLRAGSVGATVRTAAWDGVPYRVALLILLGYASLSVVIAIVGVPAHLFGRGPDLPSGDPQMVLYYARQSILVVELLWLGAFLSLLYARLRAARWLAGIAYLYPLAVDLVFRWLGPPQLMSPPWTIRTSVSWAVLAVPVLVVLLLRHSAPVERRRWLVALVGTAAVVVPGLAVLWSVAALNPFGLLCAATVAGTVGVLLARGRHGPAPWLLVLAVLGAWAAGLRLVSIPLGAYSGWSALADVSLAAVAAGVALMALVLGTTTGSRGALRGR